MATNWMLYRIRSRWLNGNLPLLVLGLLREADLCDWEILDSLYRRYGMTPETREFQNLLNSLVRQGYVEVRRSKDTYRLRVRESGMKLLSEFERVYETFARNLSAE